MGEVLRLREPLLVLRGGLAQFSHERRGLRLETELSFVLVRLVSLFLEHLDGRALRPEKRRHYGGVLARLELFQGTCEVEAVSCQAVSCYLCPLALEHQGPQRPVRLHALWTVIHRGLRRRVDGQCAHHRGTRVRVLFLRVLLQPRALCLVMRPKLLD